MKQITPAEYLLIFSICVFILQYLSKVAIENYENTDKTGDPAYLAIMIGILGTIFLGARSLYRIYELGEESVGKSNRH